MMSKALAVVLLAAACLAGAPRDAHAQSAKTLYTRALDRERALRDSTRQPTLKQLRAIVASYEAIVRRYPTSGYSDNALWQAANLSFLAYDDFGQMSDLKAGLRMLAMLRKEYPSSSLIARAGEIVRLREAQAAAPPPPPSPPPPSNAAAPAAGSNSAVLIRDVKRTQLPDGMRLTIEMDRETSYTSERLENPSRVFFDLKGAAATEALKDKSLKFEDGIVKEVRLGRHPDATRIVMDMEGVESYSVFTLYEPFRLVVDFKRTAAATSPPATAAASQPDPQAIPGPPPAVASAAKPSPAQQVDSPLAREATPVPAAPAAPPAPPSANANGQFSLARQLGLGVSRIVIDAGHGGHDPGAKANGVTESEVALDVALRLQKLLEKEPGFEVVMTRSTDVFIPLEERTKIANKESADLFLSIHANAARNTKARGVETYFLNFATNPEAEAVAARENAGSGQSMRKLPDIVRAIALNNKIDESRDFANMVQRSMVRKLSSKTNEIRNIGVKQAPFVVLIGAQMPSVLAETSFVTNKEDAALLKSAAYRQKIAEALFDAVLQYQRSLKKMRTSS
ncbi:MAG TPA: N-acetylmuramoyl-L-alanine amidase [Vicinamibacterales bacterium]